MTYVVPSLARLPRNVVLYKIVLYFNKSFSCTLALTPHLLCCTSARYTSITMSPRDASVFSNQRCNQCSVFRFILNRVQLATSGITTVVVSSMLNNVFDANNANNVNGLTTV